MSDTSASTGKMMIAAYRAARLSQRPILRSSLQHSHAARREARKAAHPVAQLHQEALTADVQDAPVLAPAPKTSDVGSVFANLVSIAVTEQNAEVARSVQQEVVCEDCVREVEPETHTAASSTTEAESAVALIRDSEESAGEPDDAASPNIAAQSSSPVDLPEPVMAAAPVAAPIYDPPLAEIGFGPGMLIRLSQLGLHTTGDLALADAAQLRLELGEISRLVDVEAWISSARQTVPAA